MRPTFFSYGLIVYAGDYVDRGLFSVETISLLTCLKLRWPDRVQLIRGNHESRAVTQVGAFSLHAISFHPRMPGILRGAPDVRFLYRVCAEIRFITCLDVLHGHVRLPNALGGHRRQDLLRTWRCETLRIHGSAPIRSFELALGLSPSIHSIDQIKVVDRFRGTCCALSCFSQSYWWCL